MTLYKKVPRKKFSYFGKCMETKDVYNYGNMNLILKTPLAIFNMQMDRKKVLLWKLSQDLGSFFLQNFNSWDFISQDLISSPHIILENISPRNLKLRTLFPVTFCPVLLNYVPICFYFQVFFSEIFFPVTFLHRFRFYAFGQVFLFVFLRMNVFQARISSVMLILAWTNFLPANSWR